MSKKAVDKLFEAMYRLTDLREIFRKTSPEHELTREQKEEVEDLLREVEKDLEIIEEEILR